MFFGFEPVAKKINFDSKRQQFQFQFSKHFRRTDNVSTCPQSPTFPFNFGGQFFTKVQQPI